MPAREVDHRVSGACQRMPQRPAEEARAAGNDNLHGLQAYAKREVDDYCGNTTVINPSRKRLNRHVSANSL
jgi:hypothetical protein